MTKAERYYNIIKWFEENVPIAESELHYDSPFHLLIAVILSAQCTDKRVNMVTPDIFVKYPDAKALASTTFEELFPLVRSISYPNSKARHLIAMAQMLSADFGGEVPSDIDDLMKLPGVGRKTANVVYSEAYGGNAIAVDTHVFRVANRIGLVHTKTPEQTEQALMKAFDESKWSKLHHLLIFQGRYVCHSQKPDCADCGLRAYCEYYRKLTK